MNKTTLYPNPEDHDLNVPSHSDAFPLLFILHDVVGDTHWIEDFTVQTRECFSSRNCPWGNTIWET
jgi:hypothetical protein